jgi:hypothetical protein
MKYAYGHKGDGSGTFIMLDLTAIQGADGHTRAKHNRQTPPFSLPRNKWQRATYICEPNEFEDIAKILAAVTSMTSLALVSAIGPRPAINSAEANSPWAQTLNTGLLRMTDLTHLDLSHTTVQIAPPGPDWPAWHGPYLPALRHLTLRSTHLSDQNLVNLLSLWQAATGLEHIDLADNAIRDLGITNLTDDLARNSTSPRHLELRQNFIGPRGAQLLGTMLTRLHTIQYFSLEQNDIENEGTLHVLDGLLHGSSTIDTLRLSYTGITTTDFWPEYKATLWG